MKYFYIVMTYLSLMLVLSAGVQAQGKTDTFQVVKSSNGQSFILNTNGGETIFTDVYFRMGPAYEFDSLSGISLLMTRMIDHQINTALAAGTRQIKYYSTIEPEQIGFHFESGAADLDYIFHLADDKIMRPPVLDDMDQAKASINADLDSIRPAAKGMQVRTMRRIWGDDYKKLNPYGDGIYSRIKPADVESFHKRYFLPYNNSIYVLGAFSPKPVLDKLQEIFKNFKSQEFNPELIDKVIDFKPVINTVQLLVTEPDPMKKKATVTYQNPGARRDRLATYSAYILAEMINDKEGIFQKSFRQAGMNDLSARFICHNFYGTFELSVTPTGNNYYDAFERLGQMIKDISQNGYFKEEDLLSAKKSIIAEYADLKSNNVKSYMYMVARYRFSNDENYFTSLPDSINAVTPSRMAGYIQDYYTDRAGVRCLVASSDSIKKASSVQQYFPLDENISDITLRYDLNKTDIETDEAKQDLDRVIQWLRINPDMHVQVNGFADEGEFTKSYDDSVMRFIDSTPTFHKAIPDATKKGFLRIEFMRAMKVAKALYEAGISTDRIAGTSMVFTSETREGAAENRKCTFSFEKLKPRLSLYELHYGHKKAEEQETGQN